MWNWPFLLRFKGDYSVWVNAVNSMGHPMRNVIALRYAKTFMVNFC